MPKGFDVDRALKAWEERFPDRGERIVVLRGMYYDAQDERPVKTRKGWQARHHPQTVTNLRAMLDAEGAA
jgi:hypothetical protein